MSDEPFYRNWAEGFAGLQTKPSIDVHGFCSVAIGGTIKRMLREIDRLSGVPQVPLAVGEAVTIGHRGTEGLVTAVKDSGESRVFYFNRAMQREEEHWFAPGTLVRVEPQA